MQCSIVCIQYVCYISCQKMYRRQNVSTALRKYFVIVSTIKRVEMYNTMSILSIFHVILCTPLQHPNKAYNTLPSIVYNIIHVTPPSVSKVS